MNRRQFFGLAASSIFVPVYGKWYRQGSGLLVAERGVLHAAAPSDFSVGEWVMLDFRNEFQPARLMRITAMDAETMTLEAPSASVSHDLW